MDLNTKVLALHDVTVAYGNQPVLWSVDFELPKGIMAGVIGPNGAGKSTLLKAIMGLLPISSGRIHLFSSELKQVRKKIAYIPQKESIDWDFPITVEEVVGMGRYVHQKWWQSTSGKDKIVVQNALEQVDLLAYAKVAIGELSGGQKQRVFIARALAQNADMYLMDEPFAGVDVASEKKIIDLLKDIQAQGKTIIVVHHDLQSAMDYFNWVIFLNKRLVASGPIETTYNLTNLQSTYGGSLSVLSQLAQIYAQKKHPIKN